jgi:hypothetical protein
LLLSPVIKDTTKEQYITIYSGIPQMFKSLSTLVQTQLFPIQENGTIETSMYRKYSTKGYISGEENLDIINKAKWRIHSIGIRQD